MGLMPLVPCCSRVLSVNVIVGELVTSIDGLKMVSKIICMEVYL
jgi:hypothetical protein